jgi:hypothetical protein
VPGQGVHQPRWHLTTAMSQALIAPLFGKHFPPPVPRLSGFRLFTFPGVWLLDVKTRGPALRTCACLCACVFASLPLNARFSVACVQTLQLSPTTGLACRVLQTRCRLRCVQGAGPLHRQLVRVCHSIYYQSTASCAERLWDSAAVQSQNRFCQRVGDGHTIRHRLIGDIQCGVMLASYR